MIRTAASLGGLFGAATFAERLPTAFHEAGHAMLAVHIAETGITGDNGCRAEFEQRPRPSILRFATITPRVTDKGQHYLGETKLLVRWRDIHRHLGWSAAPAVADSAGGPPLLSCKHLCAAEGTPPKTAMIGLARISYLMAGRAAEERLATAATPWHRGGTEEHVASLVAKPAKAVGDLRKAKQVARATLPLADAAESSCLPALNAAFGFADAVLARRWAHVCALSGALMVRGTMEGPHLEELLTRHRESLAAREGATHASPAGVADVPTRRISEWSRLLLLETLAPFPFAFGCVWGLTSQARHEPAARQTQTETPRPV